MQQAQILGDTQDRLPESDQAMAGAAPESGRRDARTWAADHPVNIRLSIPLGFGRYYVTILGGKERRGDERLADERRKHPLLKAGNVVVFAVVLTLSTVTGIVAMNAMVWAAASFLQQQGSLVIN